MRVELQDLLPTFRRQFSSRDSHNPIVLSDLVSSVYGEIMGYFDSRLSTRSYRTIYQERNPRPAEIVSEVDLAGEMWCFFPTHFFKCHHTLLETALPSKIDDLTSSIFGCGRLTILDVGAGIGTASLATIDLLHEWQHFLMSSGHSPSRIDVIVQPVETNSLKLGILSRMLHVISDRVCPHLLSVQALPPITDRYPEDSCLQVIHKVLVGGPHLLVTLSNILTWIRKWRPPTQGALRWLWRWVMDRLTTPDLPEYLLQTLSLLHGLHYDRKTVAFVETDDDAGILSREVEIAVHALATRLPLVTANTAGAGNIVFANPPCSKWHSLGIAKIYAVCFHRGLCAGTDPEFHVQHTLREALSPETLLLAWAKARHWERSMFISDEVATKLFEADLQWRLVRFRQMAYSGAIQQMYSPWILRYFSPKSAEVERPMSACALEDQMLLIAQSWVQQRAFEDSFDRCGTTSFGYRLNDQPDEFLYQHWFNCHQRFQKAVTRALQIWRGGYHQGDVSKFFDSIQKGKLAERLLVKAAEREKTIRENWKRHVLGNCWNGIDPGRGILQGHAVSGLLANAYLCPFDEEVCLEHGFNRRYFRYVDDMIWVYEDQRPEAVPSAITCSLSLRHDLILNPEKGANGGLDDYLRRIKDERLRALADRTQTVIRPLYRLAYQAFRSFRSDKQTFCSFYSQLLQQVGVFISPGYLLRKLRTQASLGERLLRLFQLGKRVSLPPFPASNDQESLVAWAKEFQARNRRWGDLRHKLSDDLLKLCLGAILALEQKNADPEQRKKLHRRVKFAAFRLAVFSHPEAPSLFRKLLHLPWLVPPHLTTRALRCHKCTDVLLEGLASSSMLVSAKCAQELGYVSDCGTRPALWKMAAGGRTEIERLAATESLLRMATCSEDERDLLLRCIATESHPYVLKNLILMLPGAGVPDWESAAERTVLRCPHQVMVDSLSWMKSFPKENVLSIPDVEPPYTRRTMYPDLELYPAYFGVSE